MADLEQLLQAIAALEAQRAVLGDAVVEAALGPMREKLAALQLTEQPWPRKPDIAGTPTQQRKLATILFLDIVSHTEYIRDLDPEETITLMDRILSRLAAPVRDFGGHITRYQGDGFKAIFGMPTARENDPENAVRAALEIQELAGQIGQSLRAEHAIPNFRLRIGINTGLVAAGGLTEGEDTVSGMPVNLAARLENAAEPGSILISHNTYRHVRGVFDVLPVEPLHLKGVGEPVRAYQVLRAKPRAFRMATRGLEGIETRMIGRQAELAGLQSLYEGILQGGVRLATVVGEAGIGKSRLLYEFDNWLELRPEKIFYFRGRSIPALRNVPLSLFRDLFAFRFEIQDNDPAADALGKFRAGTASLLEPNQADVAGHWLGFDFSASPAAARLLGSPDFSVLARAYVIQYFRRLAETWPVVIFLEDIHWTDDSSLDLILDLLGAVAGGRLLIVCLARRSFFERRPGWGGDQSAFRRFDLSPLNQADSRLLVAELLQKADYIPEKLYELVVTAAEGNPFYIEEQIKMLIEEGAIRRGMAGDERWQVLDEALAGVRIPPTLVGLLQARMDSLPSLERETLQRAAVVGRLFWDAAIADLAEIQLEQVQPALADACRRELVYLRGRSTFAGADEYSFKHSLLRDVAYESVLLRSRQIYHARVARWLETHAGERRGEYLGLIAEHYIQAGEYARAAELLEASGDGATDSGLPGPARAAYERALSLLQKAQAGNRVDRLDLQLKLAAVCRTLGDRTSAHVLAEAALQNARAAGDMRAMAEGLNVMSSLAYDEGEYGRFGVLLDEALPLARMVGGKVLIGILSQLFAHAWVRGDLDKGVAYAAETLTLAQELGQPALLCTSYKNLALLAATRSDLDQSLRYFEAGLAQARAIHHRILEADILGNMAVSLHTQGDLERAEALYRQSIQINRELVRENRVVGDLNNLAELRIDSGDLDAARQGLREALTLAHRNEDLPHVLINLFVWARLLAAEGDQSGALRLLGLLRHHPSTQQQTQPQIDAELGRLGLEPAVVEAGLAAGATLDVKAVVAEILGE